jgi:RNA polymerase sigma-70 factor (ECF subfamily)
MSEQEIIRQLKQGDKHALKAIIEMYQDYVYTIALQMVKKKEPAEEITQDVFIKVYQKINSYEHRAKFSTWLFTIVYRTALNYLEKKRILVSVSDFSPPDSDNSIDDERNMLNRNIQWQSEDTIGESDYQRQLIIYKAIDKLEIKQGVVITLFYLKDFSVSQIAEIMQLSVNTIKTHLFRGRENLKKVLLKDYSLEDLL